MILFNCSDCLASICELSSTCSIKLTASSVEAVVSSIPADDSSETLAIAGENGKGFAVVANEVKKLAEDVKFSVNDITSIVNSVQQESMEVASSLEIGYKTIQNGTSQIKETAETFDLISELIKGMTNKVGFISSELENFVNRGEKLIISVSGLQPQLWHLELINWFVLRY